MQADSEYQGWISYISQRMVLERSRYQLDVKFIPIVYKALFGFDEQHGRFLEHTEKGFVHDSILLQLRMFTKRFVFSV